MRDDKAQKLASWDSKHAVQRIKLNIEGAEVGEGFTQVIKQLVFSFRHDGDIIDVDVDVFFQSAWLDSFACNAGRLHRRSSSRKAWLCNNTCRKE